LKNKKISTILAYISYLNKISDIIEFSDKKLKEVDRKGSFESDDEVGFFFEEIKQIQSTLNQFKLKTYDRSSERKKEYSIFYSRN
jgi:hypothetical protein